ncbi:MAG: hypothetical protein U9Q30_09975, partial [Campylobacterota bacterium]|nr:hypothetical protein [Campylobacterota bacterium]
MIRTTVIKIKDSKVKTSLIDYIYNYRHFENMFIILLKNHKEDFNFLSDYSIMRAVIGDTEGGKLADDVKYIKNKYKNNQLLQDIIILSEDLKLHNLSMIIRRVKGDYKKFFTNIKKGVKTNIVRAKKLSLMNNYSIPLDTNSWSIKKKNQIGLNLKSKMFYIHHYHNRLKNIIEDFKNIKSV